MQAINQPDRFRTVIWLIAISVCALSGCRTTAPLYTWQPAQIAAPSGARIAMLPVAGPPDVARRIEQAMLAQRPASCSHLAIFTPETLVEASPIRLASTASLQNDVAGIQASRAVGAALLLQGQILTTDVDLLADAPQEEPPVNMNELFFQRREPEELAHKQILVSWRVIDGETSETLGAHSVSLHTESALKQYPDLNSEKSASAVLLSATARESWKLISPSVCKQEVELAVPWWQLGAWGVRRGNKAAKEQMWPLAEQRWRAVAQRFPWNAAAQHNLALAMAAKQEYPAAKKQLQKAKGPFAIRLPGETLFWLDQQHRQFNQAHGLGKPTEGWAFPDPEQSILALQTDAKPVNLEDLPWWTAIPFVKPPEWTWQAWLTQPWAL